MWLDIQSERWSRFWRNPLAGFSRIPLYEESVDRIVGVVYAKDLLAYLQTGIAAPDLRDIARPPYFVPETKRADELLADLRRDQTHVAIVVDEYGGTIEAAIIRVPVLKSPDGAVDLQGVEAEPTTRQRDGSKSVVECHRGRPSW